MRSSHAQMTSAEKTKPKGLKGRRGEGAGGALTKDFPKFLVPKVYSLGKPGNTNPDKFLEQFERGEIHLLVKYLYCKFPLY